MKSCLIFLLLAISGVSSKNLSGTVYSERYVYFYSQSLANNEAATIVVDLAGYSPTIITEEVSFFNCSIYSPPPELFIRFPQLHYITMNSANVQEIKLKTFVKALALQVLYLSSNNIRWLSADNFNGAVQLASLDLHGNKISQIDKSAFRGLNALGRLDLSGNLLVTLDPATLNSLYQMNYISLARNQLSSLHKDTFKNNSLLNSIYLNQNQLQTLDATTFIYTPLGFFEIKLADNKLNALSNTTFSNSFVRTLNLTGNICINKTFNRLSTKLEIETALQICNNNMNLMKIKDSLILMKNMLPSLNSILTNFSSSIDNLLKSLWRKSRSLNLVIKVNFFKFKKLK